MDIKTTKVFQNINIGGTDQTVHFNQLRHWQNTNINRRVLIDEVYEVSKYN